MVYYFIAALVIILILKRVIVVKRTTFKTFSPNWTAILKKEVRFYQKLTLAEQKGFELRMLHFLNTTRIIGFENMPINDKDRVLIAASAIIPIYRFENWEYDFISEIILHPKPIEGGGQFKGSYINGLVGSGPMEGRMMLAKDALYNGFTNYTNRRNVGIHEFAHIIDKQDGKIDGIPQVLIDNTEIGPWLNMIKIKSEEIKNKKAKIRDYALTNSAEFFAVTTEYFFEHPEMMIKKHPELYQIMNDMFTPKK